MGEPFPVDVAGDLLRRAVTGSGVEDPAAMLHHRAQHLAQRGDVFVARDLG
jgi:hypothetical protein